MWKTFLETSNPWGKEGLPRGGRQRETGTRHSRDVQLMELSIMGRRWLPTFWAILSPSWSGTFVGWPV